MKKREKEYNNHELFTIQENRMILKTEKQEAPTRCAEASKQYGMSWGLAMITLYQTVEFFVYGLNLVSDGFQSLYDFNLFVSAASLVALDHVARTLESHSALFDKMVDETDLFHIFLSVLSDATTGFAWLDCRKFLFPEAQECF